MASNGGARPGAGRPKGSKSKKTLEREIVREVYRQRVLGQIHHLMNAQMTLARGVNLLFKIEKKRTVGPKGGIKWTAQPPKLVTDKWEVEQYLNKQVDGPDIEDNEPGATYYYITTQVPNNQAIADMLDRTFDKARQAVDIDANVKFSLSDLAAQRQVIQQEEQKRVLSEMERFAVITQPENERP